MNKRTSVKVEPIDPDARRLGKQSLINAIGSDDHVNIKVVVEVLADIRDEMHQMNESLRRMNLR